MSLYPTTLFHFTTKRSLYEILKTTFKISYAREKIIGPTDYREFAAPMVSFCDLKLSELKYFLSYGKFGIGLTKDWANRNGLTPVMYINRHSDLMDRLIKGVNGVYNHLGLAVEDRTEFDKLNMAYLNVMNTYRYIKNYEGELWRKGKLKKENYRFADEREWRFVPTLDMEGAPLVGIDRIRTSNQKSVFNKKIEHMRLTFEPDDIKYLVVEKDADIGELITTLHQAKYRFDEETRNRLASRILTVEQIVNDI